jgi:hypothetical protein
MEYCMFVNEKRALFQACYEVRRYFPNFRQKILFPSNNRIELHVKYNRSRDPLNKETTT